MKSNTVLIIGGAGAVGTLLCELLLKNNQQVTVLDINCSKESQLAGISYVQGDLKGAESTSLIKKSQLIILAIPEEPAIESVKFLYKQLQPNQCLIDTMSVKSIIVEQLTMLNPTFEVCSINPMFGPSLGFQNQSVACVKINEGKISSKFLSFIKGAGADVIFFSAEEHDKYTAIIQAATHAAILSFGMTLKNLNYKPHLAKLIWTPPHKVMLALLARILSADPEVYRDIQVSNPFAQEARTAMQESIGALNANVLNSNPADFIELFKQLKLTIGQDEEDLAKLSQQIFQNL